MNMHKCSQYVHIKYSRTCDLRSLFWAATCLVRSQYFLQFHRLDVYCTSFVRPPAFTANFGWGFEWPFKAGSTVPTWGLIVERGKKYLKCLGHMHVWSKVTSREYIFVCVSCFILLVSNTLSGKAVMLHEYIWKPFSTRLNYPIIQGKNNINCEMWCPVTLGPLTVKFGRNE